LHRLSLVGVLFLQGERSVGLVGRCCGYDQQPKPGTTLSFVSGNEGRSIKESEPLFISKKKKKKKKKNQNREKIKLIVNK
jgi:hypothetical protein